MREGSAARGTSRLHGQRPSTQNARTEEVGDTLRSKDQSEGQQRGHAGALIIPMEFIAVLIT